MNKNRQKNLFRQNLNINNKNMHENISTQQSNRTADIIKSSLPSTEGRDRILISHLPAVSQCASYLFSTWLTFQTPAQSFVIAQVIHYVCKEGKLEGWTGLNCSSQQRDGRLNTDGKKQNGENKRENMTEDTTQTLPLHKGVWPAWWRAGFTICFFQLCLSSDLLPSSAFIVLFGA